jgi:hypothetical protein
MMWILGALLMWWATSVMIGSANQYASDSITSRQRVILIVFSIVLFLVGGFCLAL